MEEMPQGFSGLFPVPRYGDADRRAGPVRLYDCGIPHALPYRRKRNFGRRPPFSAGEEKRDGNTDIVIGERLEREELVHRERRGKHAAPRVGNVVALQNRLHSAVLAVDAVKRHERAVRFLRELFGGRVPIPFAIYENSPHFVPLGVQPLHHVASALQRHIKLGRRSAHQYRYSLLRTHIYYFTTIARRGLRHRRPWR